MLQTIINKFGINYKLKGVNIWYQCPFHNGKSYTSFSVDKNTGLYYCFKCGARGCVSFGDKKTIKSIILNKPEEPNFKQVKVSKDGLCYFGNYLRTRNINTSILDFLINFNFGLSVMNDGNYILQLIVSNCASYNYVVNPISFKKVFKAWGKGSRAIPFITNHKTKFKESKYIYIFEGLEDLLAFIELNYYEIDFRYSEFVCLFGITNINKVFINENKQYFLCLDNDTSGQEVVNKYSNYDNVFKIELAINGNIINGIKDWNELLINYKDNIEFYDV